MKTRVSISFEYEDPSRDHMEILQRWQNVVLAETECTVTDMQGDVFVIQPPKQGIMSCIRRVLPKPKETV